MLQFLADQIDQLDLALDQIAMRDRNFDRFALMLVDNVVELTLHEHARTKDHHNRLWGDFVEQKHDPKMVNAALGPNFDAKVRLARATKLLSEETGNSILALHSLRNVVYHQGLRHEAILHSIAIFYFQCACTVLAAFSPPFWGSSSRDRISHRAVKYLGQVSILGYQKSFAEACRRLVQVADSFEQTLLVDLHTDMANTIEDTNRSLNFLEQNSPTPMTRSQAVVDAQVWPFASTEEGQAWALGNGWSGPFDGAYVDWLSDKYPWHFRSDPIPSWRNRLRSLELEVNRHAVLRKYTEFMRQTHDIRSKIAELSNSLDHHIQMQIDAARDK
jgi:hypothetical protein